MSIQKSEGKGLDNDTIKKLLRAKFVRISNEHDLKKVQKVGKTLLQVLLGRHALIAVAMTDLYQRIDKNEAVY